MKSCIKIHQKTTNIQNIKKTNKHINLNTKFKKINLKIQKKKKLGEKTHREEIQINFSGFYKMGGGGRGKRDR